jgi:hypothetical protein
MSANIAKPTGEVENDSDGLIQNSDGINLESYALDENKQAEKADVSFDSKELKRRKKTDYFVKIEGSEKRERARKRDERKARKEKIRLMRKMRPRRGDAKEPKRDDGDNKRKDQFVLQEMKATRRKRTKEKLKALFWNGKRKIIVLSVIVVAAIAPVITINLISTNIKNARYDELVNSTERATELEEEIQGLMIDSADNYAVCVKKYEDAIASASNGSEKVLMSANYSSFIISNTGDYEKAISVLDEASSAISGASNSVKKYYYIAYVDIYSSSALDDEDKANYYQEIIDKMEQEGNEL